MKDQLASKLKQFGQEHLLAFWDQLREPQRAHLAGQIEQIDFAQIEQLAQNSSEETDWGAIAAQAKAPPAIRLHEEKPMFSRSAACEAGAAALRDGRVAALLVAGGQGTRLGFDAPKGTFPCGPVSQATLFQIHIEKVLATSRLYNVPVPLCIMTSPATHEPTENFLKEHDRFGLSEEELILFCQGTMPAVDAKTGKILLEQPGSIAQSPDGHGGMLAALASSGAMDRLAGRGIEQIFYFQVDNPLTPVCDPEFLGYHLLAESELSTLAIAKQLPDERVGNIVSVNNQVQIIEYIHLPDQEAGRRDASGQLELWAGNTAIHCFRLQFLRRMADSQGSLPFHVAQKKVPYTDPQGEQIEPQKNNALKFERFIFDLLPQAERALVVEADVAEAFAPVKNASGAAADTPETAQAAMIALHRGWLEAAGAEVAREIAVEISPLYALNAEQVREKVASGLRITEPTYFQ